MRLLYPKLWAFHKIDENVDEGLNTGNPVKQQDGLFKTAQFIFKNSYFCSKILECNIRRGGVWGLGGETGQKETTGET